jgi:hypothetical protein
MNVYEHHLSDVQTAKQAHMQHALCTSGLHGPKLYNFNQPTLRSIQTWPQTLPNWSVALLLKPELIYGQPTQGPFNAYTSNYLMML